MTVTARTRPLTALAVTGVVMLLASACASTPEQAETPRAAESTSAAPTPVSTPDATSDAAPADGDVLAERDRFIADQQQPLGEPLLSAKTPAQQQLVAEQRAHVESQGGQWSPQAESVTLALGLDACETSILNGHVVDANTFETHVATSPLIQQVGTTPEALDGAVSIMVFGTGFLCPDDAPQWESAWQETAAP